MMSWRNTFVALSVFGRSGPTIFDRVIVLNLIANTAIFYVAAQLYLLPLVSRLRPQQILVPILLLHSTRHLGMMFLARGATYPGLPPEFAYPAAFGDLVTAIIAFLAIPLVLRGSPLACQPFGRSTFSERSICLPRSLWPLFIMRR
jgi:hypothetical protein